MVQYNKLIKKEKLAKKKRIHFGKSYFISIFNEKKIISRQNSENKVIMNSEEYCMIADCYYEVYNKFLDKKYRWKHIFDLGYIIISWDRYFILISN